MKGGIYKMSDEQYRFVALVYMYARMANPLHKYIEPIDTILQKQGKFYTDEQRIMLNNAANDFIRIYPNMCSSNWKKEK